jgi:hypothetical protein
MGPGINTVKATVRKAVDGKVAPPSIQSRSRSKYDGLSLPILPMTSSALGGIPFKGRPIRWGLADHRQPLPQELTSHETRRCPYQPFLSWPLFPRIRLPLIPWLRYKHLFMVSGAFGSTISELLYLQYGATSLEYHSIYRRQLDGIFSVLFSFFR